MVFFGVLGFLVFLGGSMALSALAGALAARVSRTPVLWVPLALAACVLFQVVYVSATILALRLGQVEPGDAPFWNRYWVLVSSEWDSGLKFGTLFGVVGWVQCLKRAGHILRAPLADASGQEPAVLAPDEMRRPLRETRPAAAPVAATPPPAGMRCRASWQGTTLVIEEPRERLLELVQFPFVMLLVFAFPCLTCGTLLQLFGEKRQDDPAPLLVCGIAIGIMVLAFLVFVLLDLPSLYQRQVIEADRNGLRIKSEGLFGSKERSVPSETIAELRIGAGRLILVTTLDRKEAFVRAGNLANAETEWLRDELIRALTS